MSDDLDALRAKYKEVTGKNAFNGWDAAEIEKRISEHSTSRAGTGDNTDEPVADQAEKPAAKPRGKSKESTAPAAATSSDPSPSQAELDAMRAGTYGNRELKSR